MALLPKHDQSLQSSSRGIGSRPGGRKVARGLRITRKGLKMSQGRLLPVALATALITLLPSLLIPGTLPAAHAATSTFNPNNGTGSMTQQVASSSTALTLNQFTRTGHAFSGWCTVAVAVGAACSGTAYEDGATYSFATNLTLHARWTLMSYSYNSSSGSTIATNNQTWTSALALKGRGASTLSGYSLSGWCSVALTPGATCASVSGTSYSVGNLVPTSPATAVVNLYAIWIPTTVTWDDQGATTASSGGSANYSVSAGVASSVSQIPTTAPLKSGYSFTGWKTGTGSSVTNGSYTPLTPFGPQTFYAQWTGNTYVYNGTTAQDTTTAQSYAGSALLARSNGFTEPDYYSFGGWCTTAISLPGDSCSGTTYAANSELPTPLSSTVTLWAIWNENKVTFDPNGGVWGDGDLAYDGDDTFLSGQAFYVGGATPVRNGYDFAGWNTVANGSGTPIPVGENATLTSVGAVTLYAQWTANQNNEPVNLTVTFDSQGGSSISSGSTATDGLIASSPGTPTQTGYTFNGWFAASTGGSAITFPYTHGQIANFTLYAQWTAHSSDARLSGLALSAGTLSPTFASSTTSYTASVGNSTSSITVTPTVNQANATVEAKVGSGSYSSVTSASASSALALAVGDNTVSVRVTAQNGTTNTYTVTVTRAAASLSADASLSALAISTGTLSPTFASGDTSYTASVGNSTSSITVTPTRNQANATITVNGTSVTSGSASSGISLSVGSNTITVVVTAQNGTTTGTYTITVTRAALANNTNTVTWNSQGATTASSGGSATYTNGSSVSTIPTTAPQKSGHTFIGWFTGASSGVQVTNASFTPASPYADVTFYAHWTVNRSSSVGTWAWTNQSSAGERKWHALATSADGSKLFAGVDDGGSLYRSTDFGVTWSVIAGTSGKNWFSIASNIDGTKVAAVDRGGDIWTSTNSGSTWTQRSVGAVRNWESIASSSDGAKLVAVASNGDNNGYIYTSSNSGVSWSSDLAPAGTNKFTGVASSNDGTYLAATTWANGIYTSSNSGQTWTARTLPVPNPSGVTYLQAVASSGDGSRLVTGSRTQAGGSNGGVIFTSADYGATWKAFSQTSYDFINFTSNGDGSRLAASIYGQAGVSTSADFGATWTFQSVGLNGDIPIASNIDGSLLFVGGYGGNLWTGKIPNARVVAVLPASTSASLEAGASTPATAVSFSASSAAAAMTVTPIANPATEAATPFSVSQASVFDISVVNVSGQVTVCVDGGPNVRLWHFTNGAWVDVTTSQTATQTCGVTSSFSPFATGPVATPLLIATPTVVDTGSARREAEMQSARADITSKLQSAKELTVESFAKAEIPGITASNLEAVQAEILALPEESRTDLTQILKVARKFEVVGNIASTQVRNMSATSFVEIGLIPASSKNKVALVAAIRKLPASARDTYAEIKTAIDAETARIKSRNDRLAAIINRKTTKSTQK